MRFNCHTCKISSQKFGYEICMGKLIESKSEYNNDPIKSAAEHGHLECLKKAHGNGCPLNDICNIAAENGHIKCLEYAHKNGDKWDAKTCIIAC